MNLRCVEIIELYAKKINCLEDNRLKKTALENHDRLCQSIFDLVTKSLTRKWTIVFLQAGDKFDSFVDIRFFQFVVNAKHLSLHRFKWNQQKTSPDSVDINFTT